MNEHDQREVRRFDLFAALHGEVTLTQPVEIRDISARGMRVATSLALNLNARYEFRLTIGDRAAVVSGRVAHTRPDQNEKGVTVYLSGIEFVEVSEVSQSIINRFLEIMHLADAKLRGHARAREGNQERRSD